METRVVDHCATGGDGSPWLPHRSSLRPEPAYDCGHADSRATADSTVLDREAHEVLALMADEEPPAETWLAGFYFNDALMRLAALNDRLDKYARSKRDLAPTVRRVVNDLKHDIDPHLGEGLDIGFNEVVESACRPQMHHARRYALTQASVAL